MNLLIKVLILQGLLTAPSYAWCEKADQFPSSEGVPIVKKPFAQPHENGTTQSVEQNCEEQ